MSEEIQTIELDCAPGPTRPGDLIESIIKDTGLELRDPASMLFGNWIWDYNDVDPEVWKSIQPALEERIRNLYSSGAIRYGSW
jgi:hypothetical protein